MRDVALEVPLRALALRRNLERHDPCAAGVHVLGEALDRATLACRVSALEDDDKLLALLFHPGLELQELDLQLALLTLVTNRADLAVIRIALPPGRVGPVVLLAGLALAHELGDFVDLRRDVDLPGRGSNKLLTAGGFEKFL